MPEKERSYWLETAKKRILNNDGVEDEYAKELSFMYDELAIKTENEISSLYGKYATENLLSATEANALISGKEYSVWRKSIEEYITEASGEAADSKIMLELNTLAMKSRISRKEQLLSNIYKNMAELTKDNQTNLAALLSDVLTSNYERGCFNLQLGIGLAFPVAKINKERVKQILEYPWSTKTFSKNLWEDVDKLAAITKRELTIGLISGASIQKMSKSIDDIMGKGYDVAERLVRTECKYFANQGEIESYKAHGIKKYRFMKNGADGSHCNCASLSGGEFNIEDAVAGINLPPIHPNCKCYTLSVHDLSIWDDNRNVTPLSENVKFKEWKEKYLKNSFREVGAENIPITAKSIKAVKPVTSSVLNKKQCKQLADKQRHLLEFVKDEPVGTEAIAYYDMDFKELAKYKGKIGKVQSSSFKKEHITIHNHPDGNTFSHPDVEKFINNPSTKIMSAVGNNGSVFVLEKTKNYNGIAYSIYYNQWLAKSQNLMYNMNEYIKCMDDLLKGGKEYGINFIKGR